MSPDPTPVACHCTLIGLNESRTGVVWSAPRVPAVRWPNGDRCEIWEIAISDLPHAPRPGDRLTPMGVGRDRVPRTVESAARAGGKYLLTCPVPS